MSTTLQSRSIGACSKNSRGYGPTLGVTSVAATYQDALRGKFADQVGDVQLPADQIADQPPPTVNMLHVGRRPETSLQTILEKNLDSES